MTIIKKIKLGKATGFDAIPPEFVKWGDVVSASLLREFYLDALDLEVSAPELSDVIISHILKSGRSRKADDLNDHRPISCFSILAKVIHNIVRIHVADQVGPLQGPCQYAETPGSSSEMATFVISSLLHLRQGQPTFVLFADIKGAYDSLWKGGFLTKVYAAGLRGKLWKLLRSMVSSYPTRLKARGQLSELLLITVGLAQGSPLSGFIFTAFLDDLAALIEDEGVGVEFMDIMLAGIFMMDDLTLFCTSVSMLRRTLDLLTAYAETWRLDFAPPPKAGVLIYNSGCKVKYWKLGDMFIPTVHCSKLLGVTFADDLSWKAHVEDKCDIAKGKFHALRTNGLVGGDLSLNAATLFVTAIIWPSLHYGRASTSIFMPPHQAERDLLDSTQLDFGCVTLGVSRRAAAEGVFGELGWWTDAIAAAKYCLLFLNRVALSHPDSWQFRVLQGEQGSPQLPIWSLFDNTLQILNLNAELPVDQASWKRTLKKAFSKWASESWHAAALSHPRLQLYARFKTSLTPPFFASLPNFQGRKYLFKARLNDIDLTKIRVHGCPYCNCPLPEAGLERDETQSLVHLLVSCCSSSHPRSSFLEDASWLPANFDELEEEEKLAYILLLPTNFEGAFSPEAAWASGAYVQRVVCTVFKHARLAERKTRPDLSDSD